MQKNTTHVRAESRIQKNILLVLMVTIAVITGILLISNHFYQNRQLTIREKVNDELSAIADMKKLQIVEWRRERLTDAIVLGSIADFSAACIRGATGTAESHDDSHAVTILHKLIREKKYRTAALVNKDRKTIFTTGNREDVFSGCSADVLIEKVLKTGNAVLTDLHKVNDQSGRMHMSVLAPVGGPGETKPIGVLVLEIDPEEFLFPLIQEWPMPGGSGEVLLIRQEGDSVLYLNQLRHLKNTALRMRMSIDNKELPGTKAVMGFIGTGSGIDYRGVKVLFAARQIEHSTWKLIAKVDSDEAFSALRTEYRYSLIIYGLLVMMVMLFLIMIQRNSSARVFRKLYQSETDKNSLTQSLVQSEERFRSLFSSMTEGVALHDVIFDDKGKPCDYRIIEVNKAYEKHTGLTQDAARGAVATKLYGTEMPPYLEEFTSVGITGKPYFFETYFPPMNKHFSISVCGLGLNKFATVFEDITSRKLSETERETTIQLLSLLNSKSSLTNLMQAIASFIKTWSGCEAIGIRLKNGDDYPYFQTSGFSDSFVAMESSLCAVDSQGSPLRDQDGNPLLECMCGNVLSGHTDPEQPFFTKKGSFWTNSTTALLASTSEADRQARTRNRCHGEGYESVALIRLKFADTPIGLLQINDRRKDCFTTALVEQVERFADSIAIALEQRRNQDDLALEKERLLVTLRSIGDGVVTTDTEGRVTLMNIIAEQLTGYSLAEASGKKLTDVFKIVNEHTRETCDNPVEKVLATGGIVGLANHTSLIGKDGSERSIADSGAPIRSSDGRILGVVLVFRDVTDSKVADEKRLESEERFKKIYEEGRIGIGFVNKEFKFERVNPSFCRMLGYTESELSGRSFVDVTHPDNAQNDRSNVMKLMGGEIQTYKTDKQYITKNGTAVWGAATITAIRNSEGEFLYFVAMIEDINERKKAEESLLFEKERLAVTLRSIGDAVIATDVDGKIMLMNSVAELITGWSYFEASGRSLAEVFSIVNRTTHTPVPDPVAHVIKCGHTITLDYDTILIRKDGRELLVGDSGAPIRDTHGSIIGVVLVFRDITEKQRNDEALQRAEKLESLGVLAAGIAHDFNNLLSGLYGYLDLARETIPAESESGQYIDKAFSVFTRTKDLTGQLLTFAKGGALVRKTRYLPPMLHDTVSFALSGSSVNKVFDIEEKLWNCDVDEHQIAQVIDNIVINARDAMPKGGTITVLAVNFPNGLPIPPELTGTNYVKITIRDQGCGISPANLPYIFDPFFTTKQKGSGLGLAVSFSIVKRHGGTIDVHSEMGIGTEFCIYLPVSEGVMEHADNKKHEKHHGEGRMLVMDDEDYMREIASEMLTAMGYETVAVENGLQAIEAVQRALQEGRPFTVALLDLTIPGGMGGLDAGTVIKKLDPSIIVIASSGYSEDPVMARPESFGFEGSVKKPYYKSMLEKVVGDVMDKVRKC